MHDKRFQLKKGVDYDLLLTQQARNISNALKDLNQFISVNQRKITENLSNIEKKSLKKIERTYRYSSSFVLPDQLGVGFVAVIKLNIVSSFTRFEFADNLQNDLIFVVLTLL